MMCAEQCVYQHKGHNNKKKNKCESSLTLLSQVCSYKREECTSEPVKKKRLTVIIVKS